MGMDIVPELMIAFKAEENGNVANDNDARGASRYFSGIFLKYQMCDHSFASRNLRGSIAI